jgi:hypothetical protein
VGAEQEVNKKLMRIRTRREAKPLFMLFRVSESKPLVILGIFSYNPS